MATVPIKYPQHVAWADPGDTVAHDVTTSFPFDCRSVPPLSPDGKRFLANQKARPWRLYEVTLGESPEGREQLMLDFSPNPMTNSLWAVEYLTDERVVAILNDQLILYAWDGAALSELARRATTATSFNVIRPATILLREKSAAVLRVSEDHFIELGALSQIKSLKDTSTFLRTFTHEGEPVLVLGNKPHVIRTTA